MKKIKIGTINLRNNKINRHGGLRDDGINNVQIIVNHIMNEQFDILGTQELTRKFTTILLENLESYKSYGKYRYGSSIISKKIKIINDYNENNNIITNRNVIKTKTKLLPLIPLNFKELKFILKKKLLFPRIFTMILVKIDDEIICAMNTHLSYKMPSLQKRQLKKLLNQIKKYRKKYPVVLTGDFNMETSNQLLKTFNTKLIKLDIKRVDINEKTNSKKFKTKTAIDHIYIPSDWKIINKGITQLDDVTDHSEVFVEAIIT